jgi:FkbM family methyltransferase
VGFNVSLLNAALGMFRRDPEMFLRRCAERILPMPRRRLRTRFRGVVFDCNLPDTFQAFGMARSMYFRTYAADIVATMKRFLLPGDTFIDVGANVGYLSAVGMSLVGRGGEVHSFEPVSEYYDRLCRLSAENPNFRVFCNNLAVSDVTGTSAIAISSNNPGWNTMVPTFMRQTDVKSVAPCTTIRMDSYIEQHVTGKKVKLIKIDTEGFEFPVLRGMRRYFEGGNRPVIICEVAPDAYQLLGSSLTDLGSYMREFGYIACGLRTTERGFAEADISKIHSTTDLVWLTSDQMKVRVA